MRFLNEMGVRYHYIEVDKILKRAVATEMLLFRVHVMYTTWGQWEKKRGKEILLLVINVNQIYKNDHLINEGWCLHVKKKVFCMGCKMAILHWENVHLRQVDLSGWVPVRQ